MPHPVICYYCGETFDRDREPFIKIQERRYAHKDCAEQSGKDLKELEEYKYIYSNVEDKTSKEEYFYYSDSEEKQKKIKKELPFQL